MYRADILLAVEKTLVLVLCAGGFVLIVAFALRLTESARPGRRFDLPAICGTGFAFAILGIVIGMAVGSSRTPVVANVIPAALSFVGAVALFAVTRERRDLALVCTAVVGFSTMLFLGTVIGAFERNRATIQADRMRLDIRQLQHAADVEFAINAYRDSLGLGAVDLTK